MNNDINSLKDRCKVVTQEQDNRFVGIKVDTDKALVYFPLGFQIGESEMEIRRDILHLLNIIKEFKDKEEGHIAIDNNELSDFVEFPLNSYLDIISYFMENGYYIERDFSYKTKSKGKINWSKTIKKQNPLIQENDGFFSPIYTNYVVKEFNPNENKEISYINKHCVHECFKKLGWLFTSYIPPKPSGNIDKELFLTILYKKLNNTFKDSDKNLFQAMINILEKIDDKNSNTQFYYGTENFEHIWESLIDNAFGINNKEDYYPRAQWNLPNNPVKSDLKNALQPDTIMEFKSKVYVIDAKYYKYGYTKNPDHLPKSSDVNKQITYAEFVHNNKDVDDENIYNAFIMPYNKYDNLFDSNDVYVNIGEVIGDWRSKKFKYDFIQGILVDTKYLIYNFNTNKDSKILQLSKFIEKAYEINKKFHYSD